MVVHDLDHPYNLVGRVATQLDYEAKLVIQTHRKLVAPISFELLKSQPTPSPKVPFVRSLANKTQSLSIRAHDRHGPSRCEGGISLESVKVGMGEFDVHRQILSTVRIMSMTCFTRSVKSAIEPVAGSKTPQERGSGKSR